MQRSRILLGAFTISIMAVIGATGQSEDSPLTYTENIKPIVGKYCLPCHLAENENPSKLALDNFETLKTGGEHGTPIVSGKPDESLLYQKLQEEPPFGKRMPRGRKKMTKEEIKLIHDWIAQGAKEK